MLNRNPNRKVLVRYYRRPGCGWRQANAVRGVGVHIVPTTSRYRIMDMTKQI
jgi:hypothetical protein